MRLSAPLSLALVGTMTSLTCGFSLRPHVSLTSSSSHDYPIVSQSFRITPPSTTPSLILRGGGKTLERRVSTTVSDTNGGGSGSASAFESILNGVTSLWAAGGVVMILARAMKRIVPIALEPFQSAATPLSTFQLGSYIGMCLWFAYVEGYKGFQRKFSPLVVARSQTLTKSSPIHHILFGPLYAMGLFHATRKRKIVSWSVSLGVAGIVVCVKKLPYPWRNIVDAGVICGLTWGSVSIILNWIQAVVLRKGSTFDPALPEQ